jgi:CHASE3 domain sensor protein
MVIVCKKIIFSVALLSFLAHLAFSVSYNTCMKVKRTCRANIMTDGCEPFNHALHHLNVEL